MSNLNKNIVANYVGVGVTALMSVVVVPMYFGSLGAEAYGLVGFFMAFRAMAGMLDLGLSTVVSREVSKRLASGIEQNSVGRLVRTIEMAYWVIGSLSGGILLIWAYSVGHSWFQLSEISADTVVISASVFAVTMMVTWPIALYRGVLRALERQVDHNVILVLASILRGFGAVAVLFFIENSIVAFLLWNLLIGVFEVFAMAVTSWHCLESTGNTHDRRIDYAEFKGIWQFLSGVSCITLLGVVVSQCDKLVISNLLALEMLGYYTVAATLAASLGRLTGPIITAVFPQLTASYARGDTIALTRIFQKYSSLVGLVVAPIGIALAFFSNDILIVWTRSTEAALYGHGALSLLALAYLFNAMAHLDLNLLFAVGQTKFLLIYGVVSSIVYLPVIYLATTIWGISGAAGCWLMLNAVSFVLLSIFRNAQILKTHPSVIMLFGNMRFVLVGSMLFGLSRLVGMLVNAGPIASLGIAAIGGGAYFLWCFPQYRLIQDGIRNSPSRLPL